MIHSNELEVILAAALDTLKKVSSLAELEQTKAHYLGKSGQITELLKLLGKVPPAERPTLGLKINHAKQAIEEALLESRHIIQANQLNEELIKTALDVTLPGRGVGVGGLHPISLTLNRIQSLFHSMGFEVASGPEIETDFHNFTALNIPENHPARAMHDTFYIDDQHLLRTHTSPIQIRYMLMHQPPIKIIAPGRVYRVDSDATHSPMFHQVEGLWVDQAISFADLKSVIIQFMQHFFEREKLNVRFRPSFFPFTEPSAEIDIECVFCDGKGCRVCSHTAWLEVGGCGMVHPNVFRHVNIDSEQFSGVAFGIGLDRFTMLRYGVNDLRLFFDNDLTFLKQFN